MLTAFRLDRAWIDARLLMASRLLGPKREAAATRQYDASECAICLNRRSADRANGDAANALVFRDIGIGNDRSIKDLTWNGLAGFVVENFALAPDAAHH